MFVHTNTTRRHIRGHHDRAFTRLELVENPVTFVLLLVTMNRCMWLARYILDDGITYKGPASRPGGGSV
jgi:hypothetical protein